MNVYDFDNTIYDGESSFDFFVFCLKKRISLLKFLPPVIITLIQYKLCRITTDELTEKSEKYMADFLSMLDDAKKLISDFWDLHEHKIKDFYKRNQKPDDVIISASNDFFLGEICKRLKIKYLIASKMDLERCKIEYLCHGDPKVRLFYKRFPNGIVDEFYTDSKNDMPMIKIAKKAFFVKGNKITEYKNRR